MEITTISNVVALAAEVMESTNQAACAGLSVDAFENIVQQIFDNINLFMKWEKSG